MYIYLKNNDDLKNKIEVKGKDSLSYFMGTELIHNDEVAPRISMNNTPADVLMLNEDLKKVFLKATERCFENKISCVERKSGIYYYGKAECVVTRDADKDYKLEISTDSFNGLKDIELIRLRIMAGRIQPTISFEEPQVKVSLLQILKQLLSERKLTKFKRFILAWRLSRV